MKSIENRIRSRIQKFNKKCGYELEISRIVLWSRDWAEYQELKNGSGVIKINPDQSLRDIEEDLYHELGHAILHQYKVPNKLLSLFRDQNPKIGQTRFDKMELDEDTPPPDGYVSSYSTVNGTEEFCELLSAWVCSGYKMSGNIQFGGWIHSINKEKGLKSKITRIQQILELP